MGLMRRAGLVFGALAWLATGCFALFDFNDGSGGGGSGGSNPSGNKNGTKCTEGSECASKHCVDRVCCDTACDSACKACTAELTGKTDGDCLPVVDDTDPDGDCEPSNPKMCGQTGTCSLGECQLFGTDVLCAPASCSNGVKTLPRSCDGFGKCQDPQTRMCTCNGTVCVGECASDGDCNNTEYCDLLTNNCENKLPDGDPCQGNNECDNGHCVDGICCDDACNGPCLSCKNTHTGKADGKCEPVSEGGDPNNDCAVGMPPCGPTGVCDGSGQCEYGAPGTACGDGSCNNGTAVEPATCNGTGMCIGGATVSCGAYRCNGDACGTTCSDCANGATCDNMMCTFVTGDPVGASCTMPSTCQSGFCVDGKCCGSACAGICIGCANAKTNAQDGICAPIRSGIDPDNECDVMPCVRGAQCDGTGACQGSNTCANGQCFGPDCKLNDGQPCIDAGKCASGYCVDGVCCNTDCSGQCMECSLGACRNVSGTDACNGTDACCNQGGFGCCQGVCESTGGCQM
jgi:hypothetical protein